MLTADERISAILLQQGPVDPKFQVEVVASSINHSSSQKTRLNGLSHGIKIWTDFSSLLSQSMRLTDGRTDGRTAFSLLDRVCAVITRETILVRYYIVSTTLRFKCALITLVISKTCPLCNLKLNIRG